MYAEEYAGNGPYEDFVIEVQIDKKVYDSELKHTNEQPLPGRPGAIEVVVPAAKFPILNRSLRIKHEPK